MNTVIAIAQWFGASAPYLVGFILPPFVQILNRDIPEHGRSKFIVTSIVCIFVAVVLNWKSIFVNTSWESVEAMFATFSLILAQSEVAYRLYFKDSVLQQRIIVKLSAEKEVTPDVATATAPAE